MAAKSKFRVVNSRQEVEELEAERAELNDNNGRLIFYIGDDPVAAFVGFSSFSKAGSVVSEPANPV